jgi:antitoxin component YwqK of YwqJK toxin-antitoxin module
MDNQKLVNILQFIGEKNPKYLLKKNEEGGFKIPNEGGYRSSKNAKRTGHWEQFIGHINKLIVGEYVDGKKEGLWKVYYGDNKDELLEEMIFKNGLKNGLYKKYFLNKSIGEIGNYIDDKKEGLWKNFWGFGDDKKREISNFKNGVYHGERVIYDKAGNKLEEKNYKDGYPNGTWKFYYSNKKIRAIKRFDRDGNVWSEEYFDKQGNKV